MNLLKFLSAITIGVGVTMAAPFVDKGFILDFTTVVSTYFDPKTIALATGTGILGIIIGVYFSRKEKKENTRLRKKRKDLGFEIHAEKTDNFDNRIYEEQDAITSVTKHQDKESFSKCTSADSQSNLDSIVIMKVIGVGGCGGNAIQSMVKSSLKGVHFVCASTDIQTLQASQAPITLQLGEKLTKGLGAGSNPEIGREAAIESLNGLRDITGDADVVFVVAGMGGGTGTGAAAVIAEEAKKLGALTIGVVTKPFACEGEKRACVAEQGISELRKHVDSLIIIPNEYLCSTANEHDKLNDMFKRGDKMLYSIVRAISDLIKVPGYINVDFDDVRRVMSESGFTRIGTAVASGEGRAREAAMHAITGKPFFEDVSIAGAKAILINITATEESLGIEEYTDVVDYIRDAARSPTGDDAHMITGTSYDPSLGDEMRITVIASGIEDVASCSESRVQQDTSRSNNRPIPRPRMSFPAEESSVDFKTPSFIRYAKGKVL